MTVGKWLGVNGESIYGTDKTPYDESFDWGFCTQKDGALYCHVFDRPTDGVIILPELPGKKFVTPTLFSTGDTVEMEYLDTGDYRIVVPQCDEEINTVLKIIVFA